MREPSIHITKSQFQELLRELDIKAFPVDAFFSLSSKRALNTRAIVISNKDTKKKVTKVLLASKGDTQLTADLIYAVRVKLGHRGVRKITEFNKSQWSLCKELTSICNQFCEAFGFENAREGFIAYLDIAFKRMGKDCRNYLQRLVSMSENVFFYYESQLENKSDDNPELTQYVYNAYNKKIADAIGIVDTEPLENNPEKYQHFFHLRQTIDELNADYDEYIEAQFEALSFCNGIPEPSNMYGDKAIDRYRKYLYRNNKSSKNGPRVSGSLWDRIKQK